MFYEELKQKIESLLLKHQYREAAILIQEELNAPYIPKDLEYFLQENYKKVQAELNRKPNREPTAPSIDELKKMLKTSPNNQHLLAISAFDQVNIRLLNHEIQAFLLRSNITNDVKSLVLIALSHQAVDHTFQVLHNQELLKINPSALEISKLSDFNQMVTAKLEAIFFEKNRTLTDLAIKIAFVFLLNFFPRKFFFSVEDITAMAIKRAGRMLNEEIS